MGSDVVHPAAWDFCCNVCVDCYAVDYASDGFFADGSDFSFGVIVSDKRYIQGTSDLRYLFRAMRMEAADAAAETLMTLTGTTPSSDIIQRLQNAGIPRSRLDSLTDKGFIDPVKLFGPGWHKIADSLGLPLQRVVTDIDSMQYPATGIQAVYCPISTSSDIGVITSQITYFNITAKILGSGEWDDPNELELNKRYAEGVIFSSDRWTEDSPRFEEFSRKFFQTTTRRPTDNVLFGYDVTALLLSIIRSGVTTREQLSDDLSAVSAYTGFHSKISFVENRVNSYLSLLEYRKEKIIKIDEIQYRSNPGAP